jgi:vacuolar-type H+-ATPase subunit E/Vma4
MSKEDELREILDKTAQEIAKAQSNPRAWLSWMVYLLARLEEQATNSGSANRETYKEMLEAMQDAIRNRAQTGGWN